VNLASPGLEIHHVQGSVLAEHLADAPRLQDRDARADVHIRHVSLASSPDLTLNAPSGNAMPPTGVPVGGIPCAQ
jgi:hypothetical protein